MEESNNVLFEKKFERSWPCKYELCILKSKSGNEEPMYFKDELGRNIKAVLEDEDYTIIRIEPYKIEEMIFDLQQNKRIRIKEFIEKYLPKDSFNMISSLNNKVIVQKDDKISLFSLKTIKECERFINFMRSFLLENNNTSNIIVKDVNTKHRKYLYELLEKNGFNKRILYKQSTNHPMSK